MPRDSVERVEPFLSSDPRFFVLTVLTGHQNQMDLSKIALICFHFGDLTFPKQAFCNFELSESDDCRCHPTRPLSLVHRWTSCCSGPPRYEDGSWVPAARPPCCSSYAARSPGYPAHSFHCSDASSDFAAGVSGPFGSLCCSYFHSAASLAVYASAPVSGPAEQCTRCSECSLN